MSTESKDHSKRSSDNESKTKNKVAEMYDEEQRDLSDNYRPVQDLNGRIVSAYYDIGKKVLSFLFIPCIFCFQRSFFFIFFKRKVSIFL